MKRNKFFNWYCVGFIVIYLVIGISVFSYADERADLEAEKNQINLVRLQLQAQLGLMNSQLQSYVRDWSELSGGIQDNINGLVRDLQKIDRDLQKLIGTPAAPVQE